MKTNKIIREKLVFFFLKSLTLLVAVGVLGIVTFIGYKGLKKLSWEFIFSPAGHDGISGGILLPLAGTLILIVQTVIFAFPVGLLAGIFMNEYLREGRVKNFFRLMTMNLAGVPSIVFGLFGLAVFVKLCAFGPSILAGSLTLATLILPVLITTTEESLRQVEKDVRMASYALGAGKWFTIRKVVLPLAFPNIVSGIILSIGRIAGETAPIIFTVAASYMVSMPSSWYDQVMALPFSIYFLAVQHPDPGASKEVAYGCGPCFTDHPICF
ncbi:MAG: phosphate ABC transporter permease PstA [Leadbetterella sp.]|nr:phosphate ABC transporter permease PstA [Leadbetterella sp.]